MPCVRVLCVVCIMKDEEDVLWSVEKGQLVCRVICKCVCVFGVQCDFCCLFYMSENEES